MGGIHCEYCGFYLHMDHYPTIVRDSCPECENRGKKKDPDDISHLKARKIDSDIARGYMYNRVFENLQDCYRFLDQPVASKTEEKYRKELIQLCAVIAKEFGNPEGEY